MADETTIGKALAIVGLITTGVGGVATVVIWVMQAGYVTPRDLTIEGLRKELDTSRTACRPATDEEVAQRFELKALQRICGSPAECEKKISDLQGD